MTDVNNTIFTVKNKTNNTFELGDLTDPMETSIDTSGYDDYDSGGSVYQTISGITNANPGVITMKSHGFLDGDIVYITDCIGMTELNNKTYYITDKTTDTFKIFPAHDLNNTNQNYSSYATDSDEINTTNYNTYISSGKVNLLTSEIGSGSSFYANLPKKPFLKKLIVIVYILMVQINICKFHIMIV